MENCTQTDEDTFTVYIVAYCQILLQAALHLNTDHMTRQKQAPATTRPRY